MLPYADGARKTATRSPPLAPSRNVNTEKTPSIPDSRPRNKFRVKRKTHRNRSTKKHKQTNAATYWLLRGSPKRATESAVHRRKWLRSIVESGPHPGHLKKKSKVPRGPGVTSKPRTWKTATKYKHPPSFTWLYRVHISPTHSNSIPIYMLALCGNVMQRNILGFLRSISKVWPWEKGQRISQKSKNACKG